MAFRYVLAVLSVAMVAFAFQDLPKDFFERRLKNRSFPCPEETTILPCTCHTDNIYYMTLDCSLINTNEDLQRVFSNPFPYKKFQQFIINHNPDDPNNSLTMIPSDTFQDLEFERIIIKGTQLEIIEENVFSYSYNSLTLLDLQNNRLKDFPFETMKLYSQITTLLLDKNEIPVLERFGSNSLQTLSISYNSNLKFTSDVLEYLPNLINLNMEGIGLKQIPPHMFTNLTKVYTLNFNHNEITELEENTLDPINPSVGRLMLAYNKISAGLPKALKGLQSDAIVDLSYNRITLLTKKLFQPLFEQVPNGMIELNGNDLKCGCDMSWLFLDPSNVYLSLITDRTTCFDGTQVLFLDTCVFRKHCSPDPCDIP